MMTALVVPIGLARDNEDDGTGWAIHGDLGKFFTTRACAFFIAESNTAPWGGKTKLKARQGRVKKIAVTYWSTLMEIVTSFNYPFNSMCSAITPKLPGIKPAGESWSKSQT